jgi:hypothetical protein
MCNAVLHNAWLNRANTGKIKATPAFQPASGAVAQLGERLVRNEEATGSIPVSSTNLLNNFTCLEDRFAL